MIASRAKHVKYIMADKFVAIQEAAFDIRGQFYQPHGTKSNCDVLYLEFGAISFTKKTALNFNTLHNKKLPPLFILCTLLSVLRKSA